MLRLANFLFFKFSGGIYHLVLLLLPKDDAEPRFIQLYVLDSFEDEVRSRVEAGIHSNADATLITLLSKIIHDINPFIDKFKKIGNIMKRDQLYKVNLKILGHDDEYCSLRSDQLSVFLPDLTDQSTIYDKNHAIRLRNKDGSCSSIYELNGCYDPLHYPLLFPYGEFGYSYYQQY